MWKMKGKICILSQDRFKNVESWKRFLPIWQKVLFRQIESQVHYSYIWPNSVESKDFYYLYFPAISIFKEYSHMVM